MNKRLPAFITGIVIFLALAVGAFYWANALIDSIYAYRSPLKDSPPQPGPALGQPATRQVVFVLIDALREDTSLKFNVMPNLNRLRAQGAAASMHSRPPSFSEPGYTSLFTGAWPEISDGPAVNLDYADIPTWTQDNLFSAVARTSLKTAASGYDWFQKLIPQKDVAVSYYTQGEDEQADRAVVDAALPWLRSGSYALTLIHLDQVDYAGHHQGGPRSPNWDAAASRADALLGEILAQLDLKKDTILVVSDHGQIDAGGHGGPEAINLIEPFVLAGAGVKPGAYPDIQMVDVAPTLAALLGANLPASAQGQALFNMLTLPVASLSAIPAAEEAQQTALLKAYFQAISAPGTPPANLGVAASQAALDAAVQARQNSERLPRGLLSLVIVLPPIYLLLRHRARTVLWMLAGALIYLALFNLRYLVLDGRTYSLSSVTGATDLIVYTAITASLALSVGWLVAAFGMGLFRQAPYSAARGSQGFAALTIFLLLLPVLFHFTWNGPLPTWTLPEMWSAFIALLSMVQILVVAILGLLFMGLTGLIARIRHGSDPRLLTLKE